MGVNDNEKELCKQEVVGAKKYNIKYQKVN